MIITGPFQKGQILIPAEIKIDALNLDGSANFLVDTGSTVSFINESTALKMGIDYSKILYRDTLAGIGGEAEVYEIEGFTRLKSESGQDTKTIPRKNFLAVKHSFCEHVREDARKRILALGGIIGMDMIKGFKFTTSGQNFTLDV